MCFSREPLWKFVIPKRPYNADIFPDSGVIGEINVVILLSWT